LDSDDRHPGGAPAAPHPPRKAPMSLFFSRAWSILMLVGLAGYLFTKGVVPALSQIDADFPGYFTAARIVIDGQDTRRLYDDSWFREQMRRYGLESEQNPGKFAPFPPPTALLLVPLARYQPLTVLRILTAVSVVCLLCSIFLLARILAWHPVDSALFILLSGTAIITDLRFGQPYILVSTACILGYYLYLQRRPWLAGICLGLFAPIKYFPVLILVCFALQKQWRVVLAGGAAIAAVALVSIAVLGWDIHQIFLLEVFGNHLTGHLRLHDQGVPLTAVYQSFDTLCNRLFVFDPLRNPRPLLAAPVLRTLSLVTIKVALALAAVTSLVKLARGGSSSALAPSIGILGLLVLLIAPATATYTCALLWLPVALLIDYFLAEGARMPGYFILGAYTFIGFIPWQYVYRFEGRGGLTVLAYPRLLVLFAMFVCCVGFIVRPQRSGPPAAPVVA
jgi:Glycosyltransferase family 87